MVEGIQHYGLRAGKRSYSIAGEVRGNTTYSFLFKYLAATPLMASSGTTDAKL